MSTIFMTRLTFLRSIFYVDKGLNPNKIDSILQKQCNQWKLVTSSKHVKYLNSTPLFHQTIAPYKSILVHKCIAKWVPYSFKNVSTSAGSYQQKPNDNYVDDTMPPAKLGIVAKFKLMYKRYWYVLVPVHVITSTGWLVGFYYLSKSGVDIPALLQSMNFSESIIMKLKDSTMGHLAIAYMCYKIMTPVRYMVTVGGTTISIKYLSQWGYIRPIPSKAEFRKMYDDKKAQMKRGYEELQDTCKSSTTLKDNKK